MKEREFDSGHVTTREKQIRVLDALALAGAEGLTSREMAKIESPGDVSAVNGWGAAFTLLRQDNVITALDERRENHHVYVLPIYAGTRKTWSGYRHKGSTMVIIKHCATCTCEEH